MCLRLHELKTATISGTLCSYCFSNIFEISLLSKISLNTCSTAKISWAIFSYLIANFSIFLNDAKTTIIMNDSIAKCISD